MYSSKTFNGHKVTFFVDVNGGASFSINGSYVRKEGHESLPKVAIVKWLLVQFKTAKEDHTFLVCEPSKDDGVDRFLIYEKLGFRREGSKMIWGSPPDPVPDKVGRK